MLHASNLMTLPVDTVEVSGEPLPRAGAAVMFLKEQTSEEVPDVVPCNPMHTDSSTICQASVESSSLGLSSYLLNLCFSKFPFLFLSNHHPLA